MVVTLAGGCRVSEMHDGEPLVEAGLRIWKQIGRATGAQAISLRVMEFAPGLSPTIRNVDSDEILYVLDATHSGWANVLIDGQSREVGPDSGIYIRPHQTFAIDNHGPDSI